MAEIIVSYNDPDGLHMVESPNQNKKFHNLKAKRLSRHTALHRRPTWQMEKESDNKKGKDR